MLSLLHRNFRHLLGSALMLIAPGSIAVPLATPMGEAHQLIVVTSAGWDTPNGHLQAFERTASGWKAHGAGFDVSLGRSGSAWGMGVHPRLVHTRFGLHIIEVLGRRKGTLPAYEEVATGIRQRLQHQSRATALRQYMRLLVGQARVEGIELEGADSPLVQ